MLKSVRAGFSEKALTPEMIEDFDFSVEKRVIFYYR